jgi:MinD-like ATPase involved in chromosome partitioning or flagellar assembly
MSLLALAAAKASPGVTTTAVALAAIWPAGRRVLLVEADPGGGDLAAWFGLAVEPGLVSLAAARRSTAWSVEGHAQPLPGGLPALPGPPGAEQATAALGLLPAELLAGLDELEGTDVLVDLGRLDPGSPALPLARAARLLVLVARPTLAELQHLAHRVAAMGEVRREVGVVLVGSGPYPVAEVARALSVEVLGTLPHDRHGAALLAGASAGMPSLRRTRVVRAARTLADDLAERLAAPPAEVADLVSGRWRVERSPSAVVPPATDHDGTGR